MERRAIRLLLAVVLVAVLFHPDASVEGKEQAPARPEGIVPSNDQCGACDKEMWLHVTEARSPVNKVQASEEITGVAENVCKQMAKDVLLVFQDEKGCCNGWRTIIERVWLEVMKHDNDIVAFIIKKKRSIQELKEFLCKEDLDPVEPFSAKPSKEDEMKNSPRSAEGEDDDNESKWVTGIKNIGSFVKQIKNLGHNFLKCWQTEKPTNRAKACKNLSAFLE